MLDQGRLSQWARVGRRLEDVQAVYKGAPGGTDAAIDAVLSFLETVHRLKDWLGVGVRGPTWNAATCTTWCARCRDVWFCWM
ncbi:hypothetical protein ACFYWX_32080 [Streptomyces sp. NPDC002888]|uniref:hypothetical protein n=1 Tax=Streptomyces sp. NPDC002888 TaxID=3364668 RepID=UPI0036957A56